MNDNQKDEIGAIPSIDDDRATVDLQGQRGKKASKGYLKDILIFGGAIVLILAVAGAFVWRAFHKGDTEEAGKPVDPTLEKSVGSDTGNRGVDKLMNTIAERKAAEEKAAEEERKAAEAKRLAEEKAKQDALMAQLEAQGKLGNGSANNNASRAGGNGGNNDAPPTPQERKLQGKGLVYAGSEGKGAANGETASQSAGGGLNKALEGGTYANGQASILKDRSLLLGMGTVLPCVLKTKIVTTYQGLPICQLTKNIYSNDGNTLLLEAGTKFFGEQQNALVQGQARVFVNWTTAETPKGIRVRIDALGVDGLGAAGIPAWVDLHFWQRFGNAIMLSFIDDALATAANKISDNKNDNSIKVDNTEDAASNMASIALENSINIPPTAYINQGELISIIVPRDTYFNNVYELH
ncbi:type IV secretion system protein VirB10 [Escherichia coli]|uniref:type IV secretion system protein VirB10 n=1 Tax=Escherichia coli TaxID=562 RepID=UPI0012C3DFEB|nr:type IV secretion system protein VirB10 [Escherichia coli]EAN6540603.1 TrbI/VirB10 family protein [Salmonella enterica]EDX6306908.1 TrbI/VirB10 family protein [Salmonella enterica subsp. enterica serovar Java]EAT0220346.1 TrbI/VirB10 family protein [Salmonella enterica]EAT6264576.1 TrbI/VirB10 family protein [Salmonella enterica]EEV1955504.1 TrbI/VirB10 family protein [Escherichia coli]